jgi:hypothetical protein
MRLLLIVALFSSVSTLVPQNAQAETRWQTHQVGYGSRPFAYDQGVVWQTPTGVMQWDPTIKEARQVIAGGYKWYPNGAAAADGNHIIYFTKEGLRSNLFGLIAAGTYLDMGCPDVEGNTVVWNDLGNHIHLWSPEHQNWQENITQGTNVHISQGNVVQSPWPHVVGYSYPDIWYNYKVWVDSIRSSTDPYRYRLWFEDTSDHVTSMIYGSEVEIHEPRIYEDHIVWEMKNRDTGWDIYSWSPKGGVEVLCQNVGDQRYPTVYGNMVTWLDETIEDSNHLPQVVVTNYMPEPSSFATMLSLAMLALLGYRRKRIG